METGRVSAGPDDPSSGFCGSANAEFLFENGLAWRPQMSAIHIGDSAVFANH
jgi:hypothetical protein